MDEDVADIGQGDDNALLSDDIRQLQLLLQLTLAYCQKYQVTLSAPKTKLLVFSKSSSDLLTYSKLVNPIQIGDTKIEFVSSAEHVGVVRSTSGNMPHILQRIISHNNTLGGLLSMGLSRRHRANPLSSIRAENIYGSPVLFSGLATLILNKVETDTISLHVKETLQRLLKLHSNTPDPVVFFLAGVLPGEATLHLKQLTIFGMISRLPNNILNRIAKEMLVCSPQSDKNWFAQIRELCYQYDLPHPLLLLRQPHTQQTFKTLIKAKVTDFWQQKLRNHAAPLTSLRYFQPQYMSLAHPHPMWAAATDSYSVNKTVIVARMLSGRYRCGSLLQHFSVTATGICELCGVELEDIEHIILPRCPLLIERKLHLLKYARDRLAAAASSECLRIFEAAISHPNMQKTVQFFLDPSVLPEVIEASRKDENTLPLLFRITSTWCYSLHRLRLQLLRNVS